jgi:hypothetical protein
MYLLVLPRTLTPRTHTHPANHQNSTKTQQGLEPENIDKEFLRLWFKVI